MPTRLTRSRSRSSSLQCTRMGPPCAWQDPPPFGILLARPRVARGSFPDRWAEFLDSRLVGKAKLMSSPPWEADRHLTQDGARALIRDSFSDIDSRTLEHLGSGWQFDAYLTADGWVFRFPRRAWCEDLFASERLVHQLVAPLLEPEIAIPKVELMGAPAQGFPYKFAGHRFITGVPANTLDPSVEPTFARGIGEALSIIHSIPKEEALAAGVRELEMDDGRIEWLKRGLQHASGLRGLEPEIEPALNWIEQVALPPTQYEGPLRFIHHDLSPEHLIVNLKTGQLVGILDWTDAILGDAARDFAALVTFHGWRFAEEVLRNYHAPIDSEFRERMGYMARLLSVIWLSEAHLQGSDVAKHIEWVLNAFSSEGR